MIPVPILAALTLSVTGWISIPAQAQATEPREPVVVTAGEGLVRAAADQAFVQVTAEARARSPRAAQRDAADAMSRAQSALGDARLPKDAIRTIAYDIHPEFDYRDGRQTLRGYVARNTIEIRVDDVKRVGEIVDLVVGAGATTVGGIRFDLKNRQVLEREALRLAVADARARAEAAAGGAGRALGTIVRIDEQRADTRPPVMRLAARAAGEEVAVTPITPGEIEIRVQVTLTATLK